MRLPVPISAFLLTAQAALAGSYDGTYFPAGSDGWDCATIGADMGALAVRGNRLDGVENSCEMTNPVSVRDLPATLYDLECMGEGMVSTERVMLMTNDHGIYVIREGHVADWARCE